MAAAGGGGAASRGRPRGEGAGRRPHCCGTARSSGGGCGSGTGRHDAPGGTGPRAAAPPARGGRGAPRTRPVAGHPRAARGARCESLRPTSGGLRAAGGMPTRGRGRDTDAHSFPVAAIPAAPAAQSRRAATADARKSRLARVAAPRRAPVGRPRVPARRVRDVHGGVEGCPSPRAPTSPPAGSRQQPPRRAVGRQPCVARPLVERRRGGERVPTDKQAPGVAHLPGRGCACGAAALPDDRACAAQAPAAAPGRRALTAPSMAVAREAWRNGWLQGQCPRLVTISPLGRGAAAPRDWLSRDTHHAATRGQLIGRPAKNQPTWRSPPNCVSWQTGELVGSTGPRPCVSHLRREAPVRPHGAAGWRRAAGSPSAVASE